MGHNATSDRKEMPFLNHLEELRWRIIKSLAAVVVGAVACFFLSDQLLAVLTHPVTRLNSPPKIIFLSPIGMFLVRLNISIVGGIILGLPVIFFQVWRFVSPGLLESERRYVPEVVGLSTLCFLTGATLAYFVVLPMALKFLIGMTIQQIEPQFDIGKYIGFVLRLILAFGIVFELPVFSYFLTRIGLLTPEFLKRNRIYAIVAIFVLAAILTPPDVLSQLFMAGPLFLLYEISIWVSLIAKKKGG